MALTPKQQRWADAYLGDAKFNKTEASRLAGYKGDDKTLASVGWENFRKPEIETYIQQRLTEDAMSSEESLKHLGEIARGSMPAVSFFKVETVTEIDNDGNSVEVRRVGLDWDKCSEFGHLIKEISFTANGPKVVLHDRLKAVELINRHHGNFTDNIDHTTGGEPIRAFTEILVEKSSDE